MNIHCCGCNGKVAAHRIEALEAQLRFLVDNDSINDRSIDKEVELLLET